MRLRDIGGTAPCANPLTTPSHILQDKSSLVRDRNARIAAEIP